MTLFTLQYQPKNGNQIFGQEEGMRQLRDFILNYKSKKHKAALLYGPVGTGKTSSVHALANELKYDLLEINSSDLRNADSIKKFLGAALGQQSLFFTPKMILIDEIDNISGVKDRGCIPAMLKAITKSTFPVVMTANDPFPSKFNTLRKNSMMIQFPKLDYKAVSHGLRWVAEQEGISFDEKAVNSLARQADGDLRAALLDLQICAATGAITFDDVLHLSDRKRTMSILSAMHIIFKSSSAVNALSSLDDVDVNMDEVFLWLDANMQREYNAKALSKAYDSMSRADVFRGRITRRQHWRFLVYMKNLLTAGISVAKDEKNPTPVQYKRSSRLLRIWQSNIKNAKKKDIAAKMSEKMHISKRETMKNIGYFQQIFQHDGNAISEELDLSDDEVTWLRK